MSAAGVVTNGRIMSRSSCPSMWQWYIAAVGREANGDLDELVGVDADADSGRSRWKRWVPGRIRTVTALVLARDQSAGHGQGVDEWRERCGEGATHADWHS